MSKIASMSLVAGPQRAHPEISMHAVVLLVLAMVAQRTWPRSPSTPEIIWFICASRWLRLLAMGERY